MTPLIILVSFRTFRCPLFPKPVSWLVLFWMFLTARRLQLVHPHEMVADPTKEEQFMRAKKLEHKKEITSFLLSDIRNKLVWQTHVLLICLQCTKLLLQISHSGRNPAAGLGQKFVFLSIENIWFSIERKYLFLWCRHLFILDVRIPFLFTA